MSRILIAEDEEAIREFVVINLERAGHSVTQAVNGEEALEKFFSGTDFDIVILDIMMPIIDGMQKNKKAQHYRWHNYAYSKKSGNGQGFWTYDRSR